MRPPTLLRAFRASACTPARRWQSSFAHLEPEMQARKIRPIFEDLTPLSSYRLDVSLSDFLPDAESPRLLPPAAKAEKLPLPHHLLYFEASLPAHDLLPDGTNPAHSPGDPFHRRMWAGGSVLYNTANPLRLDGRRAVCVEGIRSAMVKGKPGDEKIFVGIERRLGYLTSDEVSALSSVDPKSDTAVSKIEDTIRQRMWRPSDEDLGDASVLERRNIVFLREDKNKSAPKDKEAPKTPPKILKAQHSPDLFEHTIVPTPKLLFRFSALTFNAHAIHLDPEFCRNNEGHKDIVFHGPLSYTFLVTLLRNSISADRQISFIEYRNLGPLYGNEPVTFCGASLGDGKYEIWIQGPDGGMKVKGTAKTVPAQNNDGTSAEAIVDKPHSNLL